MRFASEGREQRPSSTWLVANRISCSVLHQLLGTGLILAVLLGSATLFLGIGRALLLIGAAWAPVFTLDARTEERRDRIRLRLALSIRF